MNGWSSILMSASSVIGYGKAMADAKKRVTISSLD